MSDDSKEAGHEKRHHEGDVAFIQALAEQLNRNELTELTVKREYDENDRLTVSLSKQNKQVVQAVAAPAAAPAPALAPQVAAPAPVAAPAGGDDLASLPGIVTSPMVGTAYLAPEPGAAPFVAIGQQVKEGETLMIVEAMKTMNHIPAPRAGTIKRILVEDGAAVEYGAPLVILE